MRVCDNSRIAEEEHSIGAGQNQTKPGERVSGGLPEPSLLARASPLRAEPYVDELGVVTLLQVVEDRSIVEVGQIGHVLAFLVLGRVHLLELVLLEVLGLSGVRVDKKRESAVSQEE